VFLLPGDMPGGGNNTPKRKDAMAVETAMSRVGVYVYMQAGKQRHNPAWKKITHSIHRKDICVLNKIDSDRVFLVLF